MFLEQLTEGTLADKYGTFFAINSSAATKNSSKRKTAEISLDKDDKELMKAAAKINQDDLVKYILGVAAAAASNGIAAPIVYMLSRRIKSKTSDKEMEYFIKKFEAGIHRAESEVNQLDSDKKKQRAQKRIENAKKKLVKMKLRYGMK